MGETTHYETAPEDRISLPHKIVYGFGAFVNNPLAAAIGGMVIVLNPGPGMKPALAGLPGAPPCPDDAISDPLVSLSSGDTCSRRERMRPEVFLGVISRGAVFTSLRQISADQGRARR